MIVGIFLSLANLVIFLCRVRPLWHMWTGMLLVFGDRSMYVCGYTADDVLGFRSPQILDRKGKVFLANGNEIRRLQTSELRSSAS